jgi:hypothetical protein
MLFTPRWADLRKHEAFAKSVENPAAAAAILGEAEAQPLQVLVVLDSRMIAVFSICRRR